MLDNHQILRLRRLKAAAYNYIFASAFILLIQITSGGQLLVEYWLGILLSAVIGNCVFLYLIISKKNTKLREPSMTEAQIIFAALWGVLVMLALPDNRLIILMMFLPPFLFGSFKLNRRKYLRLALIVSMIFAVAIISEHYFIRERINLLYELTVWLSFSCVLLWLSLYGSYVYDTNRKLRLTNEHLTKTKSELHEKSKMLEQAANIDYLTGALNRRAIIQKIQKLNDKAKATDTPKPKSYAVLMIDVDFFKQVNDQYGHVVGDRVLKVVTSRIKSNLRERDAIARWGGEEFLLLLVDSDQKSSLDIANRIKSVFETSPIKVGEQYISITVSIGVKNVESLDNIQDTINEADTYMYQAKENGRNQIIYTDSVIG
jgi:diguanylate cyclase